MFSLVAQYTIIVVTLLFILLTGQKVHFVDPQVGKGHVHHGKNIYYTREIVALALLARRKIVEVILLNFRSNLGYKDKLEVI